MTGLLAQTAVEGPSINWEALSPFVSLVAGLCAVLLVGLGRSAFIRGTVVPVVALISIGVTAGLGVWQWDVREEIIASAMVVDNLSLALMMLFLAGAAAAVLLSWRSSAVTEAGEGEYFALLLTSVLGMLVLVAANDLVVLFVGFELLSIPLYVLCATHMRRVQSLESGLKYLIIGSVGSAALLYGLALLYGAAGGTNFAALAELGSDATGDVLFLTGIALVMVGLAFKASVAPFHQWTPDVYEGAPTPVTGFMAVATKAAAFGVILRLFDVALIGAAQTWAPAFATLAVITIIVGNVGAIGQSSLKRMLAYSSVAQAGYMLAGVVVTTRLGIAATVFYLAIYVVMNLAAFAVIVARERDTALGDDISSLYGLGRERPLLAWAMTIAMLALAGIPATAGFFGKVYLILAAVDNGYAWLGIVIVLGSAVSLAYYLRVVAAVWMRAPSEAPAPLATSRPVIAGGSPEADDEDREAGRSPGAGGVPLSKPDRGAVVASDFEEEAAGRRAVRQPEVVFVAVVCALVTIVFGVYPSPLFDVAQDAGAAITSLF